MSTAHASRAAILQRVKDAGLSHQRFAVLAGINPWTFRRFCRSQTYSIETEIKINAGLERLESFIAKQRKEPDEIRVRRGLERAAKLAGGQNQLAHLCEVEPSTISRAIGNGRVSAPLALTIEAVTAGQVSKSQLRPDLWPPTRKGKSNGR